MSIVYDSERMKIKIYIKGNSNQQSEFLRNSKSVERKVSASAAESSQQNIDTNQNKTSKCSRDSANSKKRRVENGCKLDITKSKNYGTTSKHKKIKLEGSNNFEDEEDEEVIFVSMTKSRSKGMLDNILVSVFLNANFIPL
jgi:hypothetical protein